MHPDELFVVEILRALDAVHLEALIVGTTAAVLQGAPVMTQDVDLLIRDTPANRNKLSRLCDAIGSGRPVQISPLSATLRLPGLVTPVDVLFEEIAGGLTFASLRSRSVRVSIGELAATVACLEDIIRSKEAAGRPKDLAQLPILRDTVRVKRAVDDDPDD
jgi:hypothetical protein